MKPARENAPKSGCDQFKEYEKTMDAVLEWLDVVGETPVSPDARVLHDELDRYDLSLRKLYEPSASPADRIHELADYFESLAWGLRTVALPPKLRPATGRKPDLEKDKKYALLYYMRFGKDPYGLCPDIPKPDLLSWSKLENLAFWMGWTPSIVEDFRLRVVQDKRFDRERLKLPGRGHLPSMGRPRVLSGLHTMLGCAVLGAALTCVKAIKGRTGSVQGVEIFLEEESVLLELVGCERAEQLWASAEAQTGVFEGDDEDEDGDDLDEDE